MGSPSRSFFSILGRILKALIRVLLWSLGVPVVLGSLTILMLQNGLFNWLIIDVIEGAGIVPNGQLSIGNISTDALTEARVRNIVIEDLSGNRVIWIDDVAIDFDITNITSEFWTLVTVDSVQISLWNTDVGLNLLALFASNEVSEPLEEFPTLPIAVKVPWVEVSGVEISFDGEKYVDNGYADIGISSLSNQVSWQVAVSDISGNILGKPANSSLDLSMVDQTLVITDLNAQLGNIQADAELNVNEILGQWSVQLEGETTIPPQAVSKLVELEMELPSRPVVAGIELSGGHNKLDLIAKVNKEVQIDAEISLAAKEWEGDLSVTSLELSSLISDLKDSRVSLSSKITGKGLGWPVGQSAEIELTGSEIVLLGEPVNELYALSTLTDGVLKIDTAKLKHSLANAEMIGTLDAQTLLFDAEYTIEVNGLGDLQRFGAPALLGSLNTQGKIIANLETFTGEVVGDFNGAQLRAPDLLAEVPTINGAYRLAGFTNTVSGQADISIIAPQALGVKVDSIDGKVALNASTKNGLLLTGDVNVGSAEVGDGTVVLAGVGGGFELAMTAAGEPSFRTKEMTVRELEIVPAQYKVDGGQLYLSLDQGSIKARVELLRQQKTFALMDAKGELSTGDWIIEQLVFSPTESVAWSTIGDINFVLSDTGIDHLELVMESSVGTIKLAGNTKNQMPDIRIGVQQVQADYISTLLREVAAVDVPVISNGEINAELELIGKEGRISDGSHLALTNLTIEERVTKMNVVATFDGLVSRPRFKVQVFGMDTELAAAMGSWPLEVGERYGIDCSKRGEISFRTYIPSVTELSKTLPIVPEIELESSATGRFFGPACDPELQFAGMMAWALGPLGEEVRADLKGGWREDRLTAFGEMSAAFRTIGELNFKSHVPVRSTLTGLLSKAEFTEPPDWISDVALDVSTKDADLSNLLPLIGLEEEVKGRMNGQAMLAGTLDKISLTGEFEIIDGVIGAQSLDKAAIAMHTTENNASILGVGGLKISGTVEAGEGSAELRAQLPVDPKDYLFTEVIIERFPVFRVVEIVPNTKGKSGEINGDLQIKGSFSKPTVALDVELANLAMDQHTLGISYRNVKGNIKSKGKKIVLERMSGESAKLRALVKEWGSFSATAELDIETLEANGAMSLDRFAVIENSLAVVNSSGDMQFAHQWPKTTVRGEVIVNEGLIRAQESLFLADAGLGIPQNIELDRQQRLVVEEPSVELASIIKNIDALVKVNLGERSVLDATLPLGSMMTDVGGAAASQLSSIRTRAEVSGEVTGGLQNGEITMLGSVETTGGELKLLTTEFAIQQGYVHFNGTDFINPELDLNAQVDFGEYGTVDVSLGGTVFAMVPTFDSSGGPYAYDEADIFSLLLFRRPTKYISNTESQNGAALLGMAMSSLGSKLTSTVGSRIVDEVHWDPAEGLFRVGKSLGENLFLIYEQNNFAQDDENTNQVTLEWSMLNRAYTRFVTGDNQVSSASLYYRWVF